MNQPDFDVIVAGAGAGGAAAAYYLCQSGLRTLVLDRARLPRYKACGGAIPQPTLSQFPFAVDDVIQATPASVRLEFPGMSAVEIALPDRPVVMVMRSEFDGLLLARSGAEVLDGTAVRGVVEVENGVRVMAGKRQITGRYLVGADGAASQVARNLGLRHRRQLGGALEAEVPIDGQGRLQGEFGNRVVFVFGAIPGGYAWVFPKEEMLSVGIGRLRPGRVELRGALQRVADALGIDLEGVALHGHPIPSYQAPTWPFWHSRLQEKLSTRHCVLVGDAAGLVDPLIGEGIRYAMTSARLAAEAIVHDSLAGYEAAIWREIGHSLATANLVARFFYGRPRVCFRLGLRNPAVVRLFIELLTGKADYRGIGRRLVRTTVPWALKRAVAGQL